MTRWEDVERVLRDAATFSSAINGGPLLPAGAETTYRLMGNALTALLVHPGLMERVVADRSLIPALIEETLRWETSVTLVSRNATVDTEVAGCPRGAPSGWWWAPPTTTPRCTSGPRRSSSTACRAFASIRMRRRR